MEQPEQLEYQVYREFEIQGKIGKGNYGIVFKARLKKNKKVVAIKKIINAFQNLIDAKRTYRELNYLLQIEHPAIIRLEYLLPVSRRGPFQQPSTTRLSPHPQQIRGCNTDKMTKNSSNLQRHVYAVFQYAETDLRMTLRRKEELQPIQRKFISYQLLHGIAFLHRSGLVHRDIKPQNLLLNSNPLELKICDFGMARKASTKTGSEGVLTEYVASRWYRPPQALLGISTCESSIDLWSIGCVMAQLALHTTLFSGKSTLDQLELIFKAIGLPSQSQIDNLQSQQSRYVLRTFSFSRKFKFKPLQDSLTMCSNAQIDLIIRLLQFDPTRRLSAQQALKHSYFDDVRGIKESQRLQAYSHSTANISDISESSNNQQGQKVAFTVEDYRFQIQKLQKFTDGSTNRSPSFFKTGQTMNEEIEKQCSGKQKSTKESNFLTQNKQQFLPNRLPEITKSKQINEDQPSDLLKMQKQAHQKVKTGKTKKKVMPSQTVIKTISGNSGWPTKERKTYSVKRQFKRVKENTLKSPGKSVKLKTSHHDKSFGNLTTKQGKPSFFSEKAISKASDSASVLSRPSKRSKSKERPTSKHYTSPAKEQMIKRLVKAPLNLNKSGLIKSRSTNFGSMFRR